MMIWKSHSNSARALSWVLGRGLAVAWAVGVAEGLFRALAGDVWSLRDWFWQIVWMGWLGLATGLVWGLGLRAIQIVARDRDDLVRAFHGPGLLAGWLALVTGYWLNVWPRMPAASGGTGLLINGILATILFGMFLLAGTRRLRTRTDETSGSGASWHRFAAAVGIAVLVLPVVVLTFPASIFRDRAPGTSPGSPPVIVILADTLRRDHLQTFGYPRPTSPRLDAFARDAIVFDDATTTSSLTIPSTATLFTGLYPSQHGMVWLDRSLPRSLPTLAETFRAAGYRTAAFVANPLVREELGFDQGFDEYAPSTPLVWSIRRKSAAQLLALRALRVDAIPGVEKLVPSALEWLARADDRPPFLYLHLMEPHSPYAPPIPDAELFLPPGVQIGILDPPKIQHYMLGDGEWDDWEELEVLPQVSEERQQRLIDLYDAEIHRMDRWLGRFFDELQSGDRYDRALIVFLTDHGEEFSEHGGWEHGRTLYREVVDMPLMIKLPLDEQRAAGGLRRSDLRIDLLDVFPTLCGLVGLDKPTNLQGRDLSAVILGPDERGTPFPFAPAYLERPPQLVGIRWGRWEVLRKHVRGKTTTRLFDLSRDPGELVDLSSVYPDTFALYLERLRQLQSSLGRGLGDSQAGGNAIDPDTEALLRSLGYVE